VTLAAFDASPGEALAQAAVALAFTLLMGLWVGRIVDQSADRRAVIAELEATRAELAEVSHRAGVLAERERLAGEIHDTLAQGFTSVVMLVELASAELVDDPAAARRRLAAAGETARQNLAEARSLVAALGPADLQAAPLPEAVGRLVDRFGRETGRPAGFTVAGEARALPANQEVVLLRAAQEALANVRKHAAAGRVTVTLAYGEPVRLTVADDGTGFDPAATTGGYGLAGLRRRAAEVGGTVDITSGPGGTTVEVRCSG
jgi:signal transduction histidine kinase